MARSTLLYRELVLSRNSKLVQQFCRVRANDVRTENLAVFRIANDLHESLGLARRACAAVGREGKLADLVVELLLLALRFVSVLSMQLPG